MKWILLATVLDWQPVYDDKKTCQLAAEELKKVYYQEVAACIPKPSSTAANDQVDNMFNQMMDFAKQMQQLGHKELDNSSN